MIKNLILSAIILLASLFTFGQNVGIGIAAPTEKLQVDSGNIKIGKDPWAPGKSHLLKFGDGDNCHIGEVGNDSMEIKAKFLSIVHPTGSLTKLSFHGNIRIDDGTQAPGKVLTSSDNGGNASWQTPGPLNSGFYATFSASKDVPILVPGGSFGLVSVTWDTESFDDAGSLSGAVFSAPSNGVYHFDITIAFALSGVTGTGKVIGVQLFLPLSKSKFITVPVSSDDNGNTVNASMSVTLKLSAGDTIVIGAYNGTGVTQTIVPSFGGVPSSEDFSFFTGYRLY